MNLPFLLFDLQSGNAIAAFVNERDALDALREAATEDGVESIENLSLLVIQDGHPTLIAMEDDLVQRALADDFQVSNAATHGLSTSRPLASSSTLRLGAAGHAGERVLGDAMPPDAAPASFVQLWRLRSGNVMSSFGTEQEAWDWLVQGAREFGLEELNELSLLHFVDDRPTLIAMDDELVRRVECEIAQSPSER